MTFEDFFGILNTTALHTANRFNQIHEHESLRDHTYRKGGQDAYFPSGSGVEMQKN